jgi:hypothetical protein
MPDQPSSLSSFKRATLLAALTGVGRFTCGLELHTMAQIGYGYDPEVLPHAALRSIRRRNPAAYRASRRVTGIPRRPDLYSVVHADPVMREEAVAWLWEPQMLSVVLGAVGSAFNYGTAIVLFDIGRKTLVFNAPSEDGDEKNRKRTSKNFTHYVAAHVVPIEEVTPELGPDGRPVSVSYNGQTFGRDRFLLLAWDAEDGELRGQGALQRAWKAFCEDVLVSLLETKYLEHSVDPRMIARAPSGPVKAEDGEEPQEAIDYMLDLVAGSRGGSTIGLPSDADGEGNKHYDLEPVELADVSEIWETALARRRRSILEAFCLPTEEETSNPDGIDGEIREFVDDIATFACGAINEMLATVHRFNYDPVKVPAPYARTSDVGKAAARRTIKELLALANQQPAGEIARRLDAPAALDQLGAPVREEDDAPDAPDADGTGRDPGRPRDGIGPRQDRREKRKDQEGGEPDGPPADGTPTKGTS